MIEPAADATPAPKAVTPAGHIVGIMSLALTGIGVPVLFTVAGSSRLTQGERLALKVTGAGLLFVAGTVGRSYWRMAQRGPQ